MPLRKYLKRSTKNWKVKGLIVKTGAIVDASVTESARKPKGKTTYAVADDRKEDERSEEDKKAEATQKQLIKVKQPGVDSEAAWLKKAGKLYYGYKKHLCTDDAEGLIRAVVTTPANESDMHHITDVIDKARLKK